MSVYILALQYEQYWRIPWPGVPSELAAGDNGGLWRCAGAGAPTDRQMSQHITQPHPGYSRALN